MPLIRTDDGVQIEYTLRGSGTLDILFLHGWGGAANYWDDLLTNYLDLTGLRAICISYRGHGGSDKTADGYTHDRFTRDVFAVADHVNSKRAVLAGFSMSGRFAQHMAATCPRRVLGLILVNSCGPEQIAVPEAVIEKWIQAVGDRASFESWFVQFIKQPVQPALLDLYFANCARAERAALSGTAEMFSKASIEAMVQGKIAAPVVAICGAADPLFPSDYTRERVVALYPQARLAVLDTGHESPLEAPREMAGLIEAFLAGLSTT